MHSVQGRHERHARATKRSSRQEARERGKNRNIRKPFTGTLRVRIPSGRAGTSSRKRVLRGGGQPSLRGVDSPTKSRAIEPRNLQTWRASVVLRCGGRVGFVDSVVPYRESGLAGVGEQGEWSRGFPGNLGDPDSPLKTAGSGATGTPNSGMIRRLCVCGRTGTNDRRSQVSPSEGNEVRRNGCQGVAASHSTAEAGEPT
jgi:hypothetical protein